MQGTIDDRGLRPKRRAHVMCLVAVLLAFDAGCAMSLEKPRYEVLRTFGDGLEVRRYAPHVVAQTRVPGDRQSAGEEGFRRLLGYISGKNQGEREIEMTAPVVETEGMKIEMTAPVVERAATSTAASGRAEWLVQFMMPAAFTLETLPAPLDPRVELAEVPARELAAIRYSGRWTESLYLEHLDRLTQAMARAGLVAQGTPEWARYDPPFKPWFLRTNEILIPLAP